MFLHYHFNAPAASKIRKITKKISGNAEDNDFLGLCKFTAAYP